MSDIRFENVAKSLRAAAVKALDGINLTVGDREFVAVVGPSGCGKTTCLRMAAGLEIADVRRGQRRRRRS